jgi:hypothetical protein
MNQLFIKEIELKKPVSFSEAEHLLENKTVTSSIQVINWKEFNYKPNVSFRIGHTGNEIWLKYYVTENHIRAKETRINGEVYKDSCVEFFISHDKENYYNFEFSCIGTIHLAWGPGRHNRKFVDPAIVKKIAIKSSLGDQPIDNASGEFEWEMMIRIPLDCFAYSNLNSFSKLKAAANFYKCGEETAITHYVTWNPVGTDTPDYHRPEFFGKVQFE